MLVVFSPVLYPRERLPGALEAIHSILPIAYMAETVRDTLSAQATTRTDGTWIILAGWTALSGLTA